MNLTTYEILGRPEDIEPVSQVIRKYIQFIHKPDSPDFVIVVGGDGTLAYKPNRERTYNSRILRVHYRRDNKNTQGYAADVNLDNLDAALKDIINGDYLLQEEKLIDLFINGEKKDSAITDIFMENNEPPLMLLFYSSINDTKGVPILEVPLSACDTFLASTPYGSTAWNLAIGGPIIVADPNSMTANFVGTIIKHEHYVTDSKNSVYIKLYSDAIVGVDGRNIIYEVKKGDQIVITGSDKRVHFIRTTNTYESFKEKTRRQVLHSLKPIETG